MDFYCNRNTRNRKKNGERTKNRRENKIFVRNIRPGYIKILQDNIYWIEWGKRPGQTLNPVYEYNRKTKEQRIFYESSYNIHHFDINNEFLVYVESGLTSSPIRWPQTQLRLYDRENNLDSLIFECVDGFSKVDLVKDYILFTINGACDACKPPKSGLYIYNIRTGRISQLNDDVENSYYADDRYIISKRYNLHCSTKYSIYKIH